MIDVDNLIRVIVSYVKTLKEKKKSMFRLRSSTWSFAFEEVHAKCANNRATPSTSSFTQSGPAPPHQLTIRTGLMIRTR